MVYLLPAHVDGPPAAPQRGGLQAACYPGPDVRDERGRPLWLHGVQAWPENRAGWLVVHDGTPDLDDDDTHVDYGNQDDDPQPVAGRPVLLRTSVRGPRPSRGTDMLAVMSGRVERRLEAITSQAIAREVWTGRLTQADTYELADGQEWLNPTPDSGDTWANPFLSADGLVTVPDGPLSPMRALGELESALADRVAGGPLLIHVPVAVLPEISWTLDRQGDALYTAKGSRVVPDSGYPGWGPGEDEQTADPGIWMYGSGPIQLWVGEKTVFDRMEQVVHIRDNQCEMWAERPFLTLFDPSTIVGAAVTPST